MSVERGLSHVYGMAMAFLVALGLLAQAMPVRAGDLFGDLPEFFERIANQGEGPLQEKARDLDQILRSIQTRATSEAALTGSTPGGFRYVLNEFGLPERQTTGVGTLFVERADSLGRGKFSLALSYAHLEYQSFSGDDLSSLFDIHDPLIAGTFESDMDLKTDIFALAASYGVTDRLDIGLIAPVLWHRSKGELLLKKPGEDYYKVADMDGSDSGFGDLLLLTKYNILRTRNDWSWSLGTKVKLPTGDEDKFLGTGRTDVTLRSLLSKRFRSFELNGELGYTWSGFGREADYLTYNFGANYSPTDWCTLIAEFLGSESDLDIYDTRDFAAGVRFNPISNLVLELAAKVPLDDSGLRTDITPLVLVEWKF